MNDTAAININLDFTIQYDCASGLLQLTIAGEQFTAHEDDVDRWTRAGFAAIEDQIHTLLRRGAHIGHAFYLLPVFGQAIYAAANEAGNEY